MSYKKNATNNRDALFGGLASNVSKYAKKASSSSSTSAPPVPSRTSNASGYDRTKANVSGADYGKTKVFTGPERDAKLKEAKEHQEKANKCMERGFLKKPDPVAACTFYKRAAEAYKVLGDNKSERYMRISSGDTNMMCTAYASAASDYTRAAELFLQEIEVKQQQQHDDDDDPNREQLLQENRRDASNLYKKASEAWKQMNEKAKAAASLIEAAIALNKGGAAGRTLSKEALAGIEEAIEAHVPDPLNPYSRYRQTGHSAFIDEDSEETPEKCSAETMELAKQHIVTRSYSHEPIQELVYMLLSYQEYASALYAAGAVTTVLENENLSTLTLSRSYCIETIILLGLGDVIAADQQFLNRHVQKTFYLTSRECQLSEELIRAIKHRDIDELDIARNIINGPNKTALANLGNETLRQLVQDLRISGIARRQATNNIEESNTNTNKKPESSLNDLLKMKTGYEQDIVAGQQLDSKELNNELDNLNFDDDDKDDDDDDDDVGNIDDELDALEDDDIDLR